jgi:hypothetical protein
MTSRMRTLAVATPPMKEKRVVVNDKMQRGYVYHRSDAAGSL